VREPAKAIKPVIYISSSIISQEHIIIKMAPKKTVKKEVKKKEDSGGCGCCGCCG
jgi:hypothetical protein